MTAQTATVVPVLQFKPAEPINLAEVLESQARKLIEIGVPKELKIDEAKFLDEAMAKANVFGYSIELANIGLNRICMVHYDVRDRFLAETGKVTIYTDPDKFTLYKGVVVPEGLQIGQFQFGPKYKNRKPIDICNGHDDLEELGIPKEGLTAYHYWGDDLLKESYMDFPGSRGEYGYVPGLSLHGDGPALYYDLGGNAYPGYGSVSRGKYQVS